MAQGFTKNTPVDADPTLSSDSDYFAASQSAVKSYVDNRIKKNADIAIYIDGALVAMASAHVPYLCTKPMTIDTWYVLGETLGSAGSTIVDINKNGTTIFANSADRPTLAYNDANSWAKNGAVGAVATSFVEGDIVSFDIDAIAAGAKGLAIFGLNSALSGGGVTSLITVGDGSTTVADVETIVFSGATVTNDGGGQVTVGAMPYVLVVDQKTAGTDGGTFTSGAWQTRTLNTEVSDTDNLASIATNQITLAAGTYRFKISAPAFAVNAHQAKLYNVTDAADVEVGASMYSGSSNFVTNRSEVVGVFTIASSKAFEVRHRCSSTKATNGFGEKANFGAVEKYTIAEFWKVG